MTQSLSIILRRQTVAEWRHANSTPASVRSPGAPVATGTQQELERSRRLAGAVERHAGAGRVREPSAFHGSQHSLRRRRLVFRHLIQLDDRQLCGGKLSSAGTQSGSAHEVHCHRRSEL